MVMIISGGPLDDGELAEIFARHGVAFDPATDMTAEKWGPKVHELVAKANGGNTANADEFPARPPLTPLEIKEGTFGTDEWAIAVRRDARHFSLK